MTAGRTNTFQKSKEYNTPPKYVEAIYKFFNSVDFDPCSNKYSMIGAKKEICLPENGLQVEWKYKRIFVNPPYGRDSIRHTSIYDWIRKCYISNKKYKSHVLALIPVATNTKHWKEYIFGKASICFLYDTRLKFWLHGKEDEKGAPMACAMIYYGNKIEKFVTVFSKYGFVHERR